MVIIVTPLCSVVDDFSLALMLKVFIKIHRETVIFDNLFNVFHQPVRIAENSVLIYATSSYKDQMLNFGPYLVPF